MPSAVTDVRSCPSRTRQNARACERRPRGDAAHWHVSRVTKRRLSLTGRGGCPGLGCLLRLTPAWVPGFRARPTERSERRRTRWDGPWVRSIPAPARWLAPNFRRERAGDAPLRKVWCTTFHRGGDGQVQSNRGFARALDGSGSSPPESDLATAPATPPAGAVPRLRSFPARGFPQQVRRPAASPVGGVLGQRAM